jgi:FlaA1/EpsC-like NDP-sugar epimerase
MTVKAKLWGARLQVEANRRQESLYLRFGTQFVLDAAAWAFGLVAAVFFRYDFIEDRITWWPLVAVCIAAIILQLALGWTFWLYRGRHDYGSFEEARSLLYTVLVSALVLSVPLLIFGPALSIPRSAVLIAAPIAFILMGAARYIKRIYVARASRPGNDSVRVLVYGAGYMGSVLVRRMMTDRFSMYLPVGLIDDDRSKRNLQMMGVPVLGGMADLGRAAQKTGATTLIISIARADAELLREISDAADRVGLAVKVLPVLDEILEGKTRLSDVRDLSIEDLIGRHPVDTQIESIAGYLAGKRVLVTGAGGSIGSELCRQIVKFGPAELMMLDRDETGLQQAQISILGRGLLDTKDVVLADIRDDEALQKIFDERRPEVVFHAAALKHLPMLEQYPDEAWKTNVLGTLNVLQAAMNVGVSTFVNISTDKAANPTSILGHSKRAGERITAWAAQQTGATYLSVRFGNVIGSRGSMLPTFASLIASGGPVTVTHPDVTRFFMTIPEACQLVVQAGGIGRAGEVLILDMGEPVRILDVAERMIAQSGKKIEIVFTGLREGEKLNEELIGVGETDDRPLHPKISHALIPPIEPSRLDRSEWTKRWSENQNETAVIIPLTKQRSAQ